MVDKTCYFHQLNGCKQLVIRNLQVINGQSSIQRTGHKRFQLPFFLFNYFLSLYKSVERLSCKLEHKHFFFEPIFTELSCSKAHHEKISTDVLAFSLPVPVLRRRANLLVCCNSSLPEL